MKKYPSIEQFRNIVQAVKLKHDYKGKDENGDPIYKHDSPYPTLEFKGTVKLHGTNAGVVMYKDRVEYQSRENVLSLTKDNAGFMMAMSARDLRPLFEGIQFNDYVAIYGEWCGQGIQKGIAISALPKMFVIFGCKVDDEWIEYTRSDNDKGIYNILDFPTFSINIDFENPQMFQNQLIEKTIEVEDCCPVGKCFNVEGIGEGIVWTCVTDNTLRFKTKGEKHSVSKVTTLAAVDTEMLKGIQEFVELAVTENRLLQGVDKLKEDHKEISQKSTGDYLRWVVNDVMREEEDTIVKNQFDVKKLNSAVSNKARLWYFSYLDKNIMNE